MGISLAGLAYKTGVSATEIPTAPISLRNVVTGGTSESSVGMNEMNLSEGSLFISGEVSVDTFNNYTYTLVLPTGAKPRSSRLNQTRNFTWSTTDTDDILIEFYSANTVDIYVGAAPKSGDFTISCAFDAPNGSVWNYDLLVTVK